MACDGGERGERRPFEPEWVRNGLKVVRKCHEKGCAGRPFCCVFSFPKSVGEIGNKGWKKGVASGFQGGSEASKELCVGYRQKVTFACHL